eukprot:64915-Pyramimonas_sp.AAC.1
MVAKVPIVGNKYDDHCKAPAPTLSLSDVSAFASGGYNYLPYLTPPLVPERFNLSDPHGYDRGDMSDADVITVGVKVRTYPALT